MYQKYLIFLLSLSGLIACAESPTQVAATPDKSSLFHDIDLYKNCFEVDRREALIRGLDLSDRYQPGTCPEQFEDADGAYQIQERKIEKDEQGLPYTRVIYTSISR